MTNTIIKNVSYYKNQRHVQAICLHKLHVCQVLQPETEPLCYRLFGNLFLCGLGKKKQQLETNCVVLFSEENTSRLVKGCSVAWCQTLISGHPVRKHHLCQTGQHHVCAD